MAGCEKCWSDAGMRTALCGGSQTDHYHDLLKERRNDPCSPEEQCGELHTYSIYVRNDGKKQCVCGIKVADAEVDEVCPQQR